MSSNETVNQDQEADMWLLRQMAAGDYKAFTTLYERHVKKLSGYGLRFTNDITIVEDCLHDLFVWLWTKRATIQIQTSLSSYLLKSLRTSIFHRLELDAKKQGRNTLATDEEDGSYGFSLSPEAERIEREGHQQQAKDIAQLLDKLTGKQREVIYLRFFEQMSFEQIAAHMDISVKGCYKLAGRAMAVLREQNPLLALLIMINYLIDTGRMG